MYNGQCGIIHLSLTQHPLKHSFGGLAQLARATALQAVGQRFDSVILHFSSISYKRSLTRLVKLVNKEQYKTSMAQTIEIMSQRNKKILQGK